MSTEQSPPTMESMAECDLCPVCQNNRAGFGQCAAYDSPQTASEESEEPIDCPCCDECREVCAATGGDRD